MEDLAKKIDSLMKKADSTEKKLDEVMQLMKRVSAIEESGKKLEEKVSKLTSQVTTFEQQNTKFAKRFDTIESAFAKQKKKWNEECEAIKLQFASSERLISDTLEAGARLRNLRVNLIPALKDEKLGEIIGKLFRLVGMELTINVRFYRLKTANSADTIILNFPSEFEKEIFFDHYRNVAAKLVISALIPVAPEKDGNIFISHDLCQTQYKVSRETLKLRGDIIKKVRIMQGFVHIQLENNKPFIRILSIDMLHKLVETTSRNKLS